MIGKISIQNGKIKKKKKDRQNPLICTGVSQGQILGVYALRTDREQPPCLRSVIRAFPYMKFDGNE